MAIEHLPPGLGRAYFALKSALQEEQANSAQMLGELKELEAVADLIAQAKAKDHDFPIPPVLREIHSKAGFTTWGDKHCPLCKRPFDKK